MILKRQLLIRHWLKRIDDILAEKPTLENLAANQARLKIILDRLKMAVNV